MDFSHLTRDHLPSLLARMPKAELPHQQEPMPPGIDGKFQGWLKQMMEKRNAA